MTHFDRLVTNYIIAFDMSINKDEVKSIIQVEISNTQGIILSLTRKIHSRQ